MILTVFLCLLSHREATTDDADRFSVSRVFSRESVVVMDTRREATMVSCPSGLFVWSSDRDSGPVCNRLADVKDPVAAEQQILFFLLEFSFCL